MKETVMKGTVAVLGASIVSYFGTLAAPLLVLLFVMIVDYVTGMVKAYMAAQLSSKIGLRGILKKLCYMACLLYTSYRRCIFQHWGSHQK